MANSTLKINVDDFLRKSARIDQMKKEINTVVCALYPWIEAMAVHFSDTGRYTGRITDGVEGSFFKINLSHEEGGKLEFDLLLEFSGGGLCVLLSNRKNKRKSQSETDEQIKGAAKGIPSGAVMICRLSLQSLVDMICITFTSDPRQIKEALLVPLKL